MKSNQQTVKIAEKSAKMVKRKGKTHYENHYEDLQYKRTMHCKVLDIFTIRVKPVLFLSTKSTFDLVD